MILFFKTTQKSVIATQVDHQLNEQEIKELCWLYGDATLLDGETLDGYFVGPRREMITPWSTNAVEITQNMGLKGIQRIEEYFPVESKDAEHDPMLQRMYNGLNQNIFTVNIQPDPRSMESFFSAMRLADSTTALAEESLPKSTPTSLSSRYCSSTPAWAKASRLAMKAYSASSDMPTRSRRSSTPFNTGWGTMPVSDD